MASRPCLTSSACCAFKKSHIHRVRVRFAGRVYNPLLKLVHFVVRQLFAALDHRLGVLPRARAHALQPPELENRLLHRFRVKINMLGVRKSPRFYHF